MDYRARYRLSKMRYVTPCEISSISFTAGGRIHTTVLAEISPHVLFAYSKKMRETAWQGKYQSWYGPINNDIYHRPVKAVVVFMNRACAEAIVRPVDLRALIPEEVVDALDFASELGVDPALLQMPAAASDYVAHHGRDRGRELRDVAQRARRHDVVNALRACQL